jgi:hypothetical protein
MVEPQNLAEKIKGMEAHVDELRGDVNPESPWILVVSLVAYHAKRLDSSAANAASE